MPYDPQKHHRRSIRLKGYDYSQPGAYFVTMVAFQREIMFGEIVDGRMHLSAIGMIVQRAWLDLPHHYPHIMLDAFCIMPNHVHWIIIMNDPTGRGGSGDQTGPTHHPNQTPSHVSFKPMKTRPYYEPEIRPGLPEIVRGFKSFSARRINRSRRTPGVPVWQRNYFERIIRDEKELQDIRKYITDNPLKWEFDQENPLISIQNN